MNITFFKRTCVLSLILGAILALPTLIPIIRNFTFLGLILLSALIVMFFMKKTGIFPISNNENALIFGALSGFFSFIAFCVVFIPLCLFIGFFIKSYNTFGMAYFLNFSGLWLFILIIISLALINSAINSVIALGAVNLTKIPDFKSILKEKE